MTHLDTSPFHLAPEDTSHDSGTAFTQSLPENDSPARHAYQLRILFGPLFGVDIRLPESEVFFHVGNDVPATAPGEHSTVCALEQATNVLYIPYPGSTGHFRLRLSSNGAHPDPDGEPHWNTHQVEFVGHDQIECLSFAHNAPLRHGAVAFAVKHVDESWSDAVLNFSSAVESDGPGSACQPESAVDAKARRVHYRWVALLAIVLVAILTGIGYWQVHSYVSSRQVATVANMLAQAPAPNAILPGRDGIIHVISSTDDGADWDRQALLKASPTRHVQVTSLASEKRQLEHQLITQGITVVSIRLDTPASPTVVVMGGTDARIDVSRLEQQVQQLVPYATRPQVLVTNMQTIEQSARTMLDAIDAHYRVTPRPQGVTFELLGSPTDTQLAALQNRVLRFSQLWGTRYVNFDIAMRPSRLNDKSYWDGDGRYILVHPDSWYFPQPLNGVI